MQLLLDIKWQILSKRNTGVKGNNVSRTVGCCSCGSNFKAVVIKYAEQTNKYGMTRKYSVSQGTEGENNQNLT
jgi:hypothetical protein